MGKIIGIDLGTTNSCVAVLEGKEPELLKTRKVIERRPPLLATAMTTRFWSVSLRSGRQLPTPKTPCSR